MVEDENETPRHYLTAADILAVDDREYRDIEVPEWGGWITVRGLTAGERDKYESSMLEGKGKNQKVNLANARARLLVLGIVHPETKKPMFNENQVRALAEKSAAAIERLFDAIRELSGMTEEDIEELTGNSEEVQSDDSTSA